MKRSRAEILEEIAKVETAQKAAVKKESRCTQRLEELKEAEYVMACLAEFCRRGSQKDE